MDRQASRQINFYLRLHYPMRITATSSGFRGSFPDLPGCTCSHWDLPRLYAALEEQRRQWLTNCVCSGSHVPLPNSHLELPRREPRRPMPEPKNQQLATANA